MGAPPGGRASAVAFAALGVLVVGWVATHAATGAACHRAAAPHGEAAAHEHDPAERRHLPSDHPSSEVYRLRAELREKTEALAAARDCGGEAEGGTVEAELAALRDQLRQRRETEAALRQEIKELKGKVADSKESIQSLRAAVHEVPCQQMHKELARAEEKFRAAKQGLVQCKERESGDCQNVLKEERGKWQDRMFGVMGVTLRAQTKAFECEQQEESPEDAAEAIAAVRLAHARDLKWGDRIDKQEGTNLNAPADDGLLGRAVQRAVLEAADSIVAENGTTALSAVAVRSLLELPAARHGKVTGKEKQEALDGWEDAVRDAHKQLLQGLELKAPHNKRARMISRTVDAEEAFPHVYEGIQRHDDTLSWEKRFNNFRDRKMTTTRRNAGKHKVWVQPTGVDDVYRAELGKPPGFDTCALVGNSQRVLLHESGGEIDEHDAVFRLNNAPTSGYEKFVGKRTTHRILNNQWTREYSAPIVRLTRLPLEWNTTLLISRADTPTFMGAVEAIKQRRGDVRIVRVHPETATGVSALLDKLRARAEGIRGVPYAGKGSPSSGFLAIYLLTQLCKKVDVYGVGLGGCWGVGGGGCMGGSTWHYWEEDLKELSAKSREFSEEPHHSFQLEYDMLRALDAAGHITIKLPESKERMAKESKTLRESMPDLMRGAQETAMRNKALADVHCSRATGTVCGCPKQCVNPNEMYLRQHTLAVKKASKELRSKDAHSRGGAHSKGGDKHDDEDGGEEDLQPPGDDAEAGGGGGGGGGEARR